jgi:hypothetical protein
MIKQLAIVFALAGCGGSPLLANAPHPNNAAVAGVAAAAAAAMMLADPNGNTFKRESKLTPDEQREVDSHATVPKDVFDRLDQEPAPQPGAKPQKPKAPADEDVGQPLPAGPDDHPNPLAPKP